MKRLLCLLILGAATISISYAGSPAVIGQVGVQGSAGYSSVAHGPASAGTFGQVNAYGTVGLSNGFHNNNARAPGPVCTPYARCVTPVFISSGPASYSNYQVISGPVGTTTTYDSGATYYYVAAPAPQVYVQPVAPTPAVATTTATTSGALAVGVLDAKGYIHSPYSNSIFKVPNIANGQPVHDPVTGQAFCVQAAGARQAVASNQFD